ncbi:MAG TPA: NADH-quinone oxidoreductase subunit H [Verrucomicrobiota bacterium]|nr:NADH-quinone oxidoreductase subunit H [Verrucomicrobiota bacterium]HNU52719.1 NADH-quinone oxidoreductase subunit H [Verrucomicrobiota bacterium]
MNSLSILPPVLALGLSPLLIGVIQRTKAVFAGRKGPSLFQPYFDLWKLWRKGAVYSRTTTWVFRAGPVMGLAAVGTATLLVPIGSVAAPLAFAGDLVLFAYLLGLMRFVTVLAALDTGSAFEGMGASREVWVSALAEPALLLALGVVAQGTNALSLSGMFAGLADQGLKMGPALALVLVALLIVVLAENARIPVDDPATHLELTMIHEVMVLDHSGPDLGFVLYGAAVKLWVLGLLIVNTLLPLGTGSATWSLAMALGGMLGLAVVIGAIESVMARLRLVVIPQLLVGAGALAAVALMLGMR